MTEIDLENKIIEVIDILKNEIDTKKKVSEYTRIF